MDLTNIPVLALARGDAPPQSGERTAVQVNRPTLGALFNGNLGSRFDIGTGYGAGVRGFNPPPPGTFDVYRKIAAYPTISLALEKITGPIIDAPISWVAKKKSVSQKLLDLLGDTFDSIMPDILRDGVPTGIKYGFAAFEKVWQERDGYVVCALKPLSPDITTFLYDPRGKLVGVRNKPDGSPPVDLDWTQAFVWTYGGEAGNPYGLSRLENVRKRWREAEQIIERFAKYLAKVAAIICQIHYPDGTSKNAAGADWPNAWLAAQIAEDVAKGRSILVPNKFAAFLSSGQVTGADLEKALASAGKSEWVISFLDPGGTDFAPGFTAALEYYDKLLVRGLLQPERSILEGHHGTKAEAGQHNEMTVLDSSGLYKSFLRAFNQGVVNDVLTYNAGEPMRGMVYAEAPPLDDDSGESQDKVVAALLSNTNPAVSQPAARYIDYVALLEDRGIPVLDQERQTPLADHIDAMAAQQQKQAAQQAAATATAKALPAAPTPANGTPPGKGNGSGKGATDAAGQTGRAVGKQLMSRARVRRATRAILGIDALAEPGYMTARLRQATAPQPELSAALAESHKTVAELTQAVGKMADRQSVVHFHAAQPPEINVDPHINIQQPAITVEAAKAPDVHVDVQTPDVTVNPPAVEVKAPVINVNVPAPRPMNRTIDRDGEGRITRIADVPSEGDE